MLDCHLPLAVSLMQAILRSVYSLDWPLAPLRLFLHEECIARLCNENFLDLSCNKLLLTKVLQTLVLLGSLAFKLPIILNILKRKGGDGLNPYSLYLETSAYISLQTYNKLQSNPIFSYLDCIAASIQNLIIIRLLFQYGIKGIHFSVTHIMNVILSGLAFQVLLFNLPKPLWGYIATYFIVVMTISRVPQIIANFQAKSKGVQSFFSSFLSMSGAAAKLFVNLNSTNDTLLIGGALLSFALNLILFLQVTWLGMNEMGEEKKKVAMGEASQVEGVHKKTE